ncbi:AtpZ/AtpI family protein [Azospirillum sp. YIM B02556]|uniref:AtpZ/AtpI family protein n=1 Tax=Azospirillum endophyticum TaxID=2800326 RepID=A0ABS1F7J7_9PROT|nr:AtpZ/AtpI family protein [Azospirillum endophyticum]MBK1839222.1 AtpZ/AtpI family protein [Azospirillum endophyticum]
MTDEQDPLADSIRRKRKRREQWLREGERPMGRNLALIGALGWLVIVPTLAGLFAGRWLDERAGGGIFWTAALLFAGVALGGWLAWNRIGQER